MKKLDPHIKEGVEKTIVQVIDFYEQGVGTHSLGIRHLRGNICEARYGLKVRVLYPIGGHDTYFNGELSIMSPEFRWLIAED